MGKAFILDKTDANKIVSTQINYNVYEDSDEVDVKKQWRRVKEQPSCSEEKWWRPSWTQLRLSAIQRETPTKESEQRTYSPQPNSLINEAAMARLNSKQNISKH